MRPRRQRCGCHAAAGRRERRSEERTARRTREPVALGNWSQTKKLVHLLDAPPPNSATSENVFAPPRFTAVMVPPASSDRFPGEIATRRGSPLEELADGR